MITTTVKAAFSGGILEPGAYPPTNLNIPLTARTGVEILAWRDLRSLDGKLSISDRFVTEIALGVLIVAGLIETTVRVIFTALLFPVHMCEKNGSELYKALSTSARIGYASIVMGTGSLVKNIFCKWAFPGTTTIFDDKNSISSGDYEYLLFIEVIRDTFNEKCYTITRDQSGKLTRTPLTQKA